MAFRRMIFGVLLLIILCIGTNGYLNPGDKCMNNEDEYVQVRFFDDDDYPYVTARCSNGYLIVDVKEDENWLEYFTSYINYREYLIGPTKDDRVNWNEWFLPDVNQFVISPDCQTCDESHILNEEYGTSSAYYMNAVTHGCAQFPVGRIGCDMDFYTYQCHACNTSLADKDGYWSNVLIYNGLNQEAYDNGEAVLFREREMYEDYLYGLCGFTIRDALAKHYTQNDTFEHCKRVTHEDLEDEDKEHIIPRRKPSLGIDSKFCQCVKPRSFDEMSFLEATKTQTQTQSESLSLSQSNTNIKTELELTIDNINENNGKSRKHTNDAMRKHDDQREGWMIEMFDNDPLIHNDVNMKLSDRFESLIFYNQEETYTTYKLYQKDFEHGTYRITKPGKYVIMEDITFDFNAPDNWQSGNLDTYNGERDWYPNVYDNDQDDYPGVDDLRGAFFLGFFAGISVECGSTEEGGVVLDLQGHTLQMSKALFYQQSFFAIISITNQPFLPAQGSGFFGPSPMASKNVTIKNGILGLSSHHGIHGNLNKNILIEDVKIHSFKTHGIQLNGFNYMILRNVEIYENQYEDKLTPFYAHLRHYLPIHRKMIRENEEIGVNDICLDFNNRANKEEVDEIYMFYRKNSGKPESDSGPDCVILADLVHNIEKMLNIAFQYAVFDKTEEELMADMDSNTQKLWEMNKEALVNANRGYHPWTATLYGIFLNYVGSNVLGWYAGSENTKSNSIRMENVYIHDLTHDTFENIAFSRGGDSAGQFLLNCLNAPFNAYQIFGQNQVNMISECVMYGDVNDLDMCKNDTVETVYDLRYAGNILTDVQLSTFYLINSYEFSWTYCAAGANDLNSLVRFAMEGVQFPADTPQMAVSHDPMIHPGKGVLGLRLNGVNDVKLSNINIENIKSSTKLGTLVASSYETTVSQQKPYMTGFTMNMANGLSATMVNELTLQNINIDNVKSETGLANGIALWYQTNLLLEDSSINIKNIIAGYNLKDDSEFVDDIIDTDDYLPNKKPEACAFKLYYDDKYPITVSQSVVNNLNNNEDNDIINIECVRGYQTCQMESVDELSDQWLSLMDSNTKSDDVSCDESLYLIEKEEEEEDLSSLNSVVNDYAVETTNENSVMAILYTLLDGDHYDTVKSVLYFVIIIGAIISLMITLWFSLCLTSEQKIVQDYKIIKDSKGDV